MNFEPLLKFGVDQGATAIHLQAGSPAQLRIGGLMRNVEGPAIESEALAGFIDAISPPGSSGGGSAGLEPPPAFSAVLPAAGRFRCAAYRHVGGPGLVLRVVPPGIRTVEELGLPPAVKQIAMAGRGLCLVVGPGGSGRTTTLAAMVDAINETSLKRITTVEAPVEYIHARKKSLVAQMELGPHVPSFEAGLALALRQDSDVLVVGELRDAATTRLALGAAESGRQVLAAMTGLSSVHAIETLLGLVGSESRGTVLGQFARSLEGVVAQRLARTREGKLVPAVEILRAGSSTSKALSENRLKDFGFIIEGRQAGMQSLDQHLVDLYQANAISGTEAMRWALEPESVGAALRAPKPSARGSAGSVRSGELELEP